MARDMIEAEAPTVSKSETVRERWIAELRRQGHRKCTHSFQDNGRVCALGLLGEVAGVDPKALDWMTGSEIGALVGLRLWQAQDIVARNDGAGVLCAKEPYHKHTFAEIADVVEGWFK